MVANKTSSGEELIAHLSAKAGDRRRAPVHRRRAPARWQRLRAARGARAPGEMLDQLHAAGLLSSGMIGDPDPYTATINALELFHVDDVVISTLPGRALGLAALEPDRARAPRHADAGRAVVVDAQAADRRVAGRDSEAERWRQPASATQAARHARAREHHGPPAANRSSRVEPPLLGMLLFIISEVMVFGAFFTAYFFIRIAQGDPWPAPGTHLPVSGRAGQHADPGLLVVHDALGRAVDQARQPLRPEGRDAARRSCSAARSCSSRSTSTPTSASRRRTPPSRRSSTRSPACTAPTCSSACCCC